jgi:hypothetical protein
MAARGVHFALADVEIERLRSFPDDADRLNYLVEELETIYFEEREEYLAESDKAWDAMHRALADGELTWDGGEYPLNHVVLAGELLYSGSDYIMSLKTPIQVRDIAVALSRITEQDFRQRYFAIDPESYGCPIDDDDFSYTWEWFNNVRRLYLKAATYNRHVLFTADQ